MSEIDNKKLAKANRYWKSFLQEIKKVNREPRVSAILIFLMNEYYINELLIMNKKLKNHHEQMKFEEKLEKLKELKLMPNPWIHDIKKLYEIRNGYAHMIEVRDQFIAGKLNACTSFQLIQDSSKDTHKKFLLYSQIIMKQLMRTYADSFIDTQL